MTLVQKEVKKIMMRPNWVEKQIRPDTWWKPWANTLAYYPLTSETTVNDMSGNNHNLTTSWSWILYDSLWVGLSNSSFFSWSAIIPPAWPFTINVWAKYTTLTNEGHVVQQFNSSTNGSAITIWCYNNNWFSRWKGSGDLEVAPITANQWTNVVYVYTSGTVKFYINCTGYTQSRTINTTTPNYFWVGSWWETYRRWYMNWNISELIIENKARTDQEVSDYYNLTKWNYWL